MPSLAITVPYMRTSPLYIPRRDLVLASADSLYLRVTIVDSDNPCAQALALSGGIGGPSAQLLFWADTQPKTGWGGWYDYGWGYYTDGWPYASTRQMLLTVPGALSDATGAFDFSVPSGTMSSWPLRCGWAVQLNYDSAGAEVLMTGTANIRRGLGLPFTLAAPVLETDAFIPIHTDTEEQVLA